MAYRETFFMAKYPQITEPLPVSEGGKRIGIFFTIFSGTTRKADPHHSYDPSSEVFYARNFTYIYRQLALYTDILDVGRVRIFLERGKAYDDAMPILEQAGLASLARHIPKPQHLDQMNMSYRFQSFFNAEMRECDYIFSMDDDIWFYSRDKNKFPIWENFTNELDEIYEQAIQEGQQPADIITYENELKADRGGFENYVLPHLMDTELYCFSELARSYRNYDMLNPVGVFLGFRNNDTLALFERFFKNYYYHVDLDEALVYAFKQLHNKLVIHPHPWIPLVAIEHLWSDSSKLDDIEQTFLNLGLPEDDPALPDIEDNNALRVKLL